MHNRFFTTLFLCTLILSGLVGCSDMLMSGGGVEAGNPRVVGAEIGRAHV